MSHPDKCALKKYAGILYALKALCNMHVLLLTRSRSITLSYCRTHSITVSCIQYSHGLRVIQMLI